MDALIYVTVLVTVLSGLDYFFGVRRLMAQSTQRAESSAPVER